LQLKLSKSLFFSVPSPVFYCLENIPELRFGGGLEYYLKKDIDIYNTAMYNMTYNSINLKKAVVYYYEINTYGIFREKGIR
jgi:hypothetical protein